MYEFLSLRINSDGVKYDNNELISKKMKIKTEAKQNKTKQNKTKQIKTKKKIKDPTIAILSFQGSLYIRT